jgi:hypothetical protein
MRVRTFGLSALALGILIGAGGCSSESPTSPLAPASAAANRGGIPNAAAAIPQDTMLTVQSRGYSGSGSREETVSTTGYSGSGS